MKNNKKSPLKDKPLRNPGQSLDKELDDLFMDKVLGYFIVAAFAAILFLLEWYRYYMQMMPNPVVITILSIPIILYSVYRIYRIIPKARALKLGRDGERVVGQYLEQVRDAGDRVFHDIVGDQFNLDHVIISRHGIFIIETKTYSKPEKGEPLIQFDGETLTIDHVIDASHLLNQVRAQKSWLTEILRESTGKDFTVSPVIVFPGWFIKAPNSAFKSGVWVINPKALPKFIQNQPELITLEDQKLAAFHLSRYIRTR